MTIQTSIIHPVSYRLTALSGIPPAVFILLLSIAAMIGYFTQHQLDKSKACRFPVLTLPILSAALLLFRKGFTLTFLQGFILTLILLWASASDIRTRTVPDYLSVMVLITALIDTELSALPHKFLALIVVALPQLIVAMLQPGRYGGADIKISAACAFLLGIWKGMFALMFGMALSIIVTMAIRAFKKQSLKEGVPLVPYLALGAFIAFLI